VAQFRDEIVRHRDPLANPRAVDHVVKLTVSNGGILAFMGHGFHLIGSGAAHLSVPVGRAVPCTQRYWQIQQLKR
jgi:hypothetical protein